MTGLEKIGVGVDPHFVRFVFGLMAHPKRPYAKNISLFHGLICTESHNFQDFSFQYLRFPARFSSVAWGEKMRLLNCLAYI
jgi:hypothetical protein